MVMVIHTSESRKVKCQCEDKEREESTMLESASHLVLHIYVPL